jgi:hypothetical protein
MPPPGRHVPQSLVPMSSAPGCSHDNKLSIFLSLIEFKLYSGVRARPVLGRIYVAVVEERARNDDVREDERDPLEPVGVAVTHNEAHDHYSGEERGRLEHMQV